MERLKLMRKSAWGIMTALVLFTGGDAAFAESGCTVGGLLQAGVAAESLSLNETLSAPGFGAFSFQKAGTPGYFPFGEGALTYHCDNWGAQIDGAFFNHSVTIAEDTNTGTPFAYLSNPQGHIGGAVFFNANKQMRLGLAGSYILNSSDLVVPDFGGSQGRYESGYLRFGGFGQWFASDVFTLSAGAFYVGGPTNLNDPLFGSGLASDESGFEGHITAKFYPAPQFSLMLRGDAQSGTMISTCICGSTMPFNGYAITGEVEYLVPHSRLSMALGGRYAQSNYGPLVPAPGIELTDAMENSQAYVSLKIAFGGPVPGSLYERDRNAPYDNTSVFREKLPSYNQNLDNAQFTP